MHPVVFGAAVRRPREKLVFYRQSDGEELEGGCRALMFPLPCAASRPIEFGSEGAVLKAGGPLSLSACKKRLGKVR